MNNPRRSIPPIGCVLALALLTTTARAEWPVNGLRLSSISGSYNAFPASDGHGGAFFTIADPSQYAIADWDVRLMRIAMDGSRPADWPSEGIPFAQNAEADYPGLCVANSDGSLTATYDDGSRIRAGRFFASGVPGPQWRPTSVAIAPAGIGQLIVGILPMPDGSNLFSLVSGFTPYDIWLQRVSSDGQVAPGWPSGGRPFIASSGWDVPGQFPSLLSDGADGAWTTYTSDQTNTEANVYIARINGLGDPAPGWPLHGRNITSVPGIQTQSAIAPDETGGMFVGWIDARSHAGQPSDQAEFGWDVYLQRVMADGSNATGWPVDGLPVCVWPTIQVAPRLVPDGSGGVFVAWEISGPEGNTVHAQHILPNGSIAPGWPVGGKRMFGAEGYADEMDVVSDQQGGLFVTCEIQDVNNWHVWVQHVNGAGLFDAPWGSMGMRVAIVGGLRDNQERPRMVPSLPGSAIVSWDDNRAGPFDETYVQRITVNGLVATELSLASHVATPDHVSLEWFGAGMMLTNVSIERRDAGAEWRALATLTPDANGRVTFEDRDVSPGTTYEYRLSYAADGRTATSSATTIAVPLATPFALAGARPNPAPRTQLAIAYSLAQRGPARLELFDAQGRCVATRDVSSAGVGSHTARFDEARGMHSGLYWARLSQGTQRATVRVVLVD